MHPPILAVISFFHSINGVMDNFLLSQDKLDELQKEFTELRSHKIPELAKRIDDARQLGDLSENAEYHAAREEMAWAQSRIRELTTIMDNAQIISGDNKKDVVRVGSLIVIEMQGKKRELSIVGAQEADPLSGKISNESPLGSALLGRKKGEKIEVQVPAGKQEYKIIEIK